jgi:hypothetical protein
MAKKYTAHAEKHNMTEVVLLSCIMDPSYRRFKTTSKKMKRDPTTMKNLKMV